MTATPEQPDYSMLGWGDGSVYAAYMEHELKVERDRRASLDTRGSAIVTQAGALVTLLLAAAAVTRGAATAALPGIALALLFVGVLFLLVAGLLGVLVSVPFLYRTYEVGDTSTMADFTGKDWLDPDPVARAKTSSYHRKTIDGIRSGNNRKVLVLSWAHAFQLSGLFAVGAAVLVAIAQQ